MNSLRSLSRLTAEVRRGQSSSSSLPERTLVWSMRPRDESIRITIESEGISREYTSTTLSVRSTAFSTRFMAKVVLPMDGRPATMIRSDGCRPLVFSSRSVKPVEIPVNASLVLNRWSMRSMVFTRMSPIPTGPPVFGRDSAIWKIFRSASSRTSLAPRPCGLKALSAISALMPISWRRVARSRMIWAYALMFATDGVFFASSAR
ncbi:hypothetical protein D9M71_659600 [compost metagenome]